MFGSSLPVCAVQFPTIPELVQHGVNGLVFRSAAELTAQIALLLYPEEVSAPSLPLPLPLSVKQECSTNDSVDEREEAEGEAEAGGGAGTWSDKGSGSGVDCVEGRQVEAGDIPKEVTLSALRDGAGKIGSWDDNWDAVMRPLVEQWVR